MLSSILPVKSMNACSFSFWSLYAYKLRSNERRWVRNHYILHESRGNWAITNERIAHTSISKVRTEFNYEIHAQPANSNAHLWIHLIKSPHNKRIYMLLTIFLSLIWDSGHIYRIGLASWPKKKLFSLLQKCNQINNSLLFKSSNFFFKLLLKKSIKKS